MTNRLFIFPIAFFIVILDQLSKSLIVSKLFFGETISLIPGILSLTKIYNAGAAFSILQTHTFLLTLFSLVVAVIISFYFVKKLQLVPLIIVISWGLILGGTIGNLIDRFFHGYVVDFIRLDFVNFPIFNLADLSINIGAFLLLIYIARDSFVKS